LPSHVAKACKDKLLLDLIEEIMKNIDDTNDSVQTRLESWADLKVEFANLLKNYIRISTHDVIFDTSYKEVFDGIANKLQQSLEEVLEVLPGVMTEKLSSIKIDTIPESSEYCWYCGINPALEKIDTYRYGQTDIEIKACRVCQKIIKKYATNESKEFARLSEGQKIGLVAFIPNLEVFYSSWRIEDKRNIILYEKLDDALQRIEKFKEELKKYMRKEISSNEFRHFLRKNLDPLRGNIEEIISNFKNKFPIDSWSSSVYFDDLERDLLEILEILNELEAILSSPTKNNEQRVDRPDTYYEPCLKMQRIFEKEEAIVNTIKFIVESISPFYKSFSNIKAPKF
jgi:DNA repair exonuclease SbcCD ATPase subunit